MQIPPDANGINMPLRNVVEVLQACQHGKSLAAVMHFNAVETVQVVTAISEIARNCVVHGHGGSISIYSTHTQGKDGLRIIVMDRGPGIIDIDRAMQDGYSTAGSLGIGLAVARRLTDEFEIESAVGKGTTVRMVKWKSVG